VRRALAREAEREAERERGRAIGESPEDGTIMTEMNQHLEADSLEEVLGATAYSATIGTISIPAQVRVKKGRTSKHTIEAKQAREQPLELLISNSRVKMVDQESLDCAHLSSTPSPLFSLISARDDCQSCIFLSRGPVTVFSRLWATSRSKLRDI
jgi:hypothetical protein